jgi:hypothetical protein
MKSIPILLFLAFFGLSTNAEAQRIKLTNTKSKKEVILVKGMRVVYVLKTKSATVGTLTEITTTGMSIDGTPIAYEDLKSLGKRKKGTGFGTFALSFFGGAIIGSVIFADNSDPCPQCQTVSVEDEGGTAGNILAVVGGVTLIALAVNTGVKNSPRDLSIWKLEVVD